MEISEQLRKKVAGYQPTKKTLDKVRDIPLLFLVGITSAGKNAVLDKLLTDYPDKYRFIVSHTTRAPRKNHGVMERDGADYHFVDEAKIDSMLDSQEFIEAQVIHSDWIYGTSVKAIQNASQNGRIATTDIDIQGAVMYDDLGLNVKPVFIMPPSFDVWMNRLMKRYNGNIPPRERESRIQSAIREIERAMTLEHFYIVINDNLDDTVEVVHDIASGEPVDPHYHKAMSIAEHMLEQLRAELAEIK